MSTDTLSARAKPPTTASVASWLLNAALVGILFLFLLVELTDLPEFLGGPGAYPIGAEMAGVRYRTAAHYVMFGATELALAAAGLLVPLFTRASRGTLIRAATASTLVLITLFCCWTAE